MNEQQSSFEGWAILEIFGHQKYTGYVKTEVFGTASMFRLDVPALEERQRITKGGCYVEAEKDVSRWVPAGTTVKYGATQPYTKLFGVGAIYAITPCTQEAALAAVEEIQPRPLTLVSLPGEKAIAAAAVHVCPDCGENQSDCDCLLSDDEDAKPV